MQSDQLNSQKTMTPLADQVGGGYMHSVTPPPVFGGTFLPPGIKHMRPFHDVEFQSTEVCPRNFIIFDQTDNRSQIMFHPAVAPKFCHPGPNVGASYVQEIAGRIGANNERENSSFFEEDSDDIDALLSLEEEEQEEDDEEEVSTARTYGSESPDSCSNYCSKPRRRKLPTYWQKPSGSGSSCSEVKRQRMKKMVKVLRGIIPGGNQMSTAAVLDEAVSYFKSLKVEVQKLGVEDMKN